MPDIANRLCILDNDAELITKLRKSRLESLSVQEEENQLNALLQELIEQHADLDAAIIAMIDAPTVDQLRLQRLKKQKLLWKDRIEALKNKLQPDIIA